MRWYHWAGIYLATGAVYATINRISTMQASPLGVWLGAHAFCGYDTSLEARDSAGNIGEVPSFVETMLTWPVALPYGLIATYALPPGDAPNL